MEEHLIWVSLNGRMETKKDVHHLSALQGGVSRMQTQDSQKTPKNRGERLPLEAYRKLMK
jgi:hypothetical protein